MLLTHEDVLAQLQLQLQAHRDNRAYMLNRTNAAKYFAGYRVFQLDNKVEGAELLDFVLTIDGWRSRRWVRQSNTEVLQDPISGETWHVDAHGNLGKEISMRYLSDNLSRLAEEREK